ncbi:type VI secretion system lipoprotein TssJ [Pseudoxanthomonas kalamensis DSM 18571]|uniref:type VI secretion system lipoprotein TssJ n=1 Tax=Pseudoxanthomonas kalamensis TaxID=289483 RepID=UPI001390F6A7|nr:type VI secretion system lipoprotein TssJ [Pseudoxanthomonas kalamensis]KAF1712643.1 type VI secretion system lipoprotein TssJ [Pseudoxanthomonas kalamensis DSM 18571]
MDDRVNVSFVRGLRSRLAAFPHRICFVLLLGMLAGCVSSGDARDSGGLIDKALQVVGLKKDDAQPQFRTIPLRLYAGTNLNAANDGRALALVVRVYQLRDGQRFEQAPYSAFLDEDAERSALAEDLISASELVLQPGQRHETSIRLPPEAARLGVVALFRAPAPGRWRMSFDGAGAARDGITIGLHACALTTSSAALTTQFNGAAHSLTTAHCAKD